MQQDACRDREKQIQFFIHKIIRASSICRHLLRALYFKKRMNPSSLSVLPLKYLLCTYIYLFHLPACIHFITNPSSRSELKLLKVFETCNRRKCFLDIVSVFMYNGRLLFSSEGQFKGPLMNIFLKRR